MKLQRKALWTHLFGACCHLPDGLEWDPPLDDLNDLTFLWALFNLFTTDEEKVFAR